MTNEIWCVTQYDDNNFNYIPTFEVKAANYNATLETNKFTHKWYISNVTGQIEDLKK